MDQKYWIGRALEIGFSLASPLDTAALQPRADVRQMCSANTCRAYEKNWTCPPHCGTLESCEAAIRRCSQGILLQTTEKTEKVIDTKAWRRAEARHLERFHRLAREIRACHPEALCLGSGGCRICGECAYPEPCRFPEEACSSMEGYGLFVTQVCRDNGVEYNYGEKTITYTACILFPE